MRQKGDQREEEFEDSERDTIREATRASDNVMEVDDQIESAQSEEAKESKVEA